MRHISSACPHFYLYLQIYCRIPKLFGQICEHRVGAYSGFRFCQYHTARFLQSQSGCVFLSTANNEINLPHRQVLNFPRSFTSPKHESVENKILSKKIYEANVGSNGACKRSITGCTFSDTTAEDVSDGECQTNNDVNELVLNIIENGAFSVQDVLWRWLKNLISRRNSLSSYGGTCPSDKGKKDDNAYRFKGFFVSYSDVTCIIHGLLIELGRRGLVEYVFQVVDWMEVQGWFNLDPHLCASVLHNLGKAGSLQIAEKVFRRLDEIKVKKNCVTYNALLNAYSKAGQTEAAFKLFDDMKQKCRPNLVTFNTVMDACVRGGMDLAKVVSVFKEMCLLGIHPDIISYDVALAACAEGRHVKEAEMFFQNAKKKGLKPTVVTYTSLMAVFANAGDCSAALRVFREMTADGCNPNEVTFSCLINAFGKGGQVEEAESIFEAMVNYGVVPNVVVYNTMIDLYNKNGLPNHAQHMFHKMIEAGMEPTYVSFTSLMSSFKALEAYKDVVDVYEDVKGNSSLCNVYTYTEALDSCLKWGNWDKVAKVLYDMQLAGCVPNFVTCSVLLAALGSRCRNTEEANVIVAFLKAFDSKLAINVRRMLVEIFDTDFEVKQLAEDIFLLIDERDTKTWAVFTSGLVDALWAFGWYRRAALVTGWTLEKNDYVELIAVGPLEWKLDVRRFSRGGSLVVFYQWLVFMFQVAVQLETWKSTDISQGLEAGENKDLHDEIFDGTPDRGHLSNQSVSTNIANNLGEKSGAFSSSHMVRESEILIPFLSVSPAAMSALRRSSSDRLSNFPRFLTVVTGWGKFSTREGKSQVKDSIQNEIVKLGAPFRPSADFGRWIADGDVLVHWLLKPEVAECLALHDEAAKYRV
ncbi:hypothetical protein O6H91_02G038200 [Diphasiastrum complanatum]|uniref:Uncharacterized protein n=5 Tax=Diphasiastrum complanatum TaxID=34168 RepID=A0ACC2EEC1_DIPCM|nr:hypothetical protein O6H91_02G038200 [Diphasiastrum complanatum]KAJ7564884.1 hypothetical protein O6H91_02G038200 [Diphasiastrum complanatum]KAJ7564885.1 hypothetical protein O6H91_02G038200 [Diphasiastrum complanatum]KAJ7564886.1 hypothetical protein O6H91_02G038200 [Diphasiastrum complanatum]KAJ7564887.1 hypothetical protein O6H91_02G038200 [Diphasiastrum complanatum]